MHPGELQLEQINPRRNLLVGYSHKWAWNHARKYALIRVSPELNETYGTLAIAAGTDITLSVLPFVFLWKIQISRRVKVGVCGIMALGFA